MSRSRRSQAPTSKPHKEGQVKKHQDIEPPVPDRGQRGEETTPLFHQVTPRPASPCATSYPAAAREARELTVCLFHPASRPLFTLTPREGILPMQHAACISHAGAQISEPAAAVRVSGRLACSFSNSQRSQPHVQGTSPTRFRCGGMRDCRSRGVANVSWAATQASSVGA